MPAYRRIALPILGLATLLAPAAATGATGSTVAPLTTDGSESTRAGGSASLRISARVLRPGARGSDVRKLQQMLRATGITVASTGNYLYETSRAVQRFQIAAGLKATGIAGPRTIDALREAARGPQAIESSGGLGFGGEQIDSRRLGSRIPLADGMSGRDVRQLQDYLRRAGVRSAGRPDGEFDGGTETAVRRFESREGRPVDGAFDAGDIYALFKIVGEDAKPGDAGDPSQGLLRRRPWPPVTKPS